MFKDQSAVHRQRDEFTSNEFNLFCERNGIVKQLTASYSSQQNGILERKNRTIMNIARALLKERGMPNEVLG